MSQAQGIVLASASPRRQEILERLGLPFSVKVAPIDEDSLAREVGPLTPSLMAAYLARAKGLAADTSLEIPVVAADTVVDLAGQSLGKPRDAAEALSMLGALAGRTHEVTTAIFVVQGRSNRALSVSSLVTMRTTSMDELQRYVDTGEPFDKAGAYAVQGIGSGLVEAVEGCYLAVVGLPVCALLTCFDSLGVRRPEGDPVSLCQEVAKHMAAGTGVSPPPHPSISVK